MAPETQRGRKRHEDYSVLQDERDSRSSAVIISGNDTDQEEFQSWTSSLSELAQRGDGAGAVLVLGLCAGRRRWAPAGGGLALCCSALVCVGRRKTKLWSVAALRLLINSFSWCLPDNNSLSSNTGVVCVTLISESLIRPEGTPLKILFVYEARMYSTSKKSYFFIKE